MAMMLKDALKRSNVNVSKWGNWEGELIVPRDGTIQWNLGWVNAS